MKVYLIAFIIFILADFVWLGFVAKDFYKTELGHLMADNVRWIPAIIFYLLFVFALKFFAIDPALKENDWTIALINGAFLGLVSYGAYDLTNFATLKGWSLQMTVIDMLWGSFVSGLTSLATFFIVRNYLSK
jgi:uncharacterized membrane protein